MTPVYVLVILSDWKAYLLEDMTTSTRINAFLWNRVSQGYSQVVKDRPPVESWRAWRAGHRDHEPVPYHTPASSPVHEELSSGLDGASAAAADSVAVAEQKKTPTRRGSGSNCGNHHAGGCDTGVRTVMAPPPFPAAAASAGSSSSTLISDSGSAAAGSRCGVGVAVPVGRGT